MVSKKIGIIKFLVSYKNNYCGFISLRNDYKILRKFRKKHFEFRVQAHDEYDNFKGI